MASRAQKLAERVRGLLPRELDDWAPAFAAMEEVSAYDLVSEIHDAWVKGELGPELFSQAIPIRDGEMDRRVGRFLRELPERLTSELRVEHDVVTERDARRWCWAPGWSIGQDEDLLMMRDPFMAPLLDEARHGCSKREYVLEIVGHRARDAAHHALWDGAPRLRETLELAASWVPLARAASAEPLADYLTRLAGYTAIRRVDRDEVDRRVLDLRRCRPDEATRVVARREGDHWVAELPRANLFAGELHIEVGSGRMWAEQTSKTPLVS